jgi:hypothetical protein
MSLVGNPLVIMKIPLRETGKNSGIYRSSIFLPQSLQYFDMLRLVSRKDQSKLAVVTVDKPNRPSQVNQVGIFSDPGCSIIAQAADVNETVYIKVLGVDTDPTSRNSAFVNISADQTMQDPVLGILQETESNSGIYTGKFKIPIGLNYLESLTVRSVRSPLISYTIKISTHVLIIPIQDQEEILEDVLYNVKYSNMGWSQEVSWTFHSDVDWLSFDTETLTMSGLPKNDDVGRAEVWLTLRDSYGHSDEHNFKIKVKNTAPSIEWTNQTMVMQDDEYDVNFHSDDESIGNTEYH